MPCVENFFDAIKVSNCSGDIQYLNVIVLNSPLFSSNDSRMNDVKGTIDENITITIAIIAIGYAASEKASAQRHKDTRKPISSITVKEYF